MRVEENVAVGAAVLLVLVLLLLLVDRAPRQKPALDDDGLRFLELWNTDALPLKTAIFLNPMRVAVPEHELRVGTGLGKDFDACLHVLTDDAVYRHLHDLELHTIWQGRRVLCFEHLEEEGYHRLGRAEVTFVPNQELLTEADARALRSPTTTVRHVLCKSRYAEGIMERFKQRYRCSWTVDRCIFPPICTDPFIAHPKDRGICFHMAGRSWMKNTTAVIQAWERHPDWPALIVTCVDMCKAQHAECLRGRQGATNIHVLDDFLSREQANKLLRHGGYSILPSSCEGYGHSLYEACANGNLLVTTNIPPINEHLTKDACVMLEPSREVRVGSREKSMALLPTVPYSAAFGESGSACFEVSVADLEAAIATALALTDAQYQAMRTNAFQTWQRMLDEGHESLDHALQRAGFTTRTAAHDAHR